VSSCLCFIRSLQTPSSIWANFHSASFLMGDGSDVGTRCAGQKSVGGA
jgi:hypothetical protein